MRVHPPFSRSSARIPISTPTTPTMAPTPTLTCHTVGLNLRPLDGTGSVNVWSMAGNIRLRVGNRDFRQSLDLWHSGLNAHMQSTTGNIVVESRFETRSTNVLGGDTFIDGALRAKPGTPPSSSSDCQTGQIVWDTNFVYVCTAPNVWKRAGLTAY